MYRYHRNNDSSDSFDWEEENDFNVLIQQFEKSSGRKANDYKKDARRKVDDLQEKRRLRKRLSLSSSWDDLG